MLTAATRPLFTDRVSRMVSCHCSVCESGPMRLSHLYQHLRRVHNWSDEQIREEELSIKAQRFAERSTHRCDACDRNFLTEQSWRHHFLRVHSGIQRISGMYVVCPSCQQKFPEKGELIKHWRNEHDQDIAQKPDSNFILASLNRTLRQLDSFERMKAPSSCSTLSHRRRRKLVDEIEFPEEERPEKQKKEDNTPDDLLFENEVKQEEAGPSKKTDQDNSASKANNEEHVDDTSEFDGHMRRRRKRTAESRRSAQNSEEREERRRLKAERERIRRWQNRILRKREHELAELARRMCTQSLEARPLPLQDYSTAVNQLLLAVRGRKALQKSMSSKNTEAATCYAIVGIRSAEERRRFFDLAVNNGFCDFMFLDDPSAKLRNGTEESVEYLQMPSSISVPQAQQKNKDVDNDTKEKTCALNEHLGKTSTSNNGSILNYLLSNDDDDNCSKDHFDNRSNSDDQESSDKNQASDADQAIPSKRNGRNADRTKNSCLVCGLSRDTEEIRISSRKRQQNIVLFACLHAQSIIDMDEAKRMYKETQQSCRRICHDHYIQAAAYIGKEVELICGRFPERGLNDLPDSVKDDLLSFLRIYGEHLDEEITLTSEDTSRFLYECLIKYYSRDGWSSQEKSPPTLDETRNEVQVKLPVGEEGPASQDSTLPPSDSLRVLVPVTITFLNPEQVPSTADNIPPITAEAERCEKEQKTLLTEPKKEIMGEESSNEVTAMEQEEESNEISAMDLLGSSDLTEGASFNEETPATEDIPTSEKGSADSVNSLIVISPAPTDNKDTISTSLPSTSSSLSIITTSSPIDTRSPSSRSMEKEEKTSKSPQQNDIISVPFVLDPKKVLRDQSSCLDTLNDEDFWSRFRITRRTFTKLCSTLDDVLKTKGDEAVSCSTGIRVATGLEVLGGSTQSSAGFSTTSTTRVFTDVLAALAEWSTTMVQWPDDWERKKISESFFEMTGLRNIVGCIDGTVIKGTQGLNVGLVADDKKRFRWVFAKFHSNEDDDSVFKQSSLCQQLKDGRRKGRLVGDDAYKCERFLLTPSQGKDMLTEEDFAIANTVRKAHLMVQEAITNWKRQFPILSGIVRSARLARIVVVCAALYNLSRTEHEPLFASEEQMDVDESGNHCITIE